MNLDSDIAVIGIGCRFPGANNIDEFWRVLENGENHVVDIPPERWNNDAFYSDNPDAPGKLYTKKAGFLTKHDEWDNSLFGISDNEAKRVDTQHRFVLECTHMAMEDGGITRKQLSGTKTGVYIGAMNDDYKNLSNLEHDDDTNYTATGMSTPIIAARVSYVYNLLGPCMVVDTACSSSITAIHLASAAIQSGECDMAICGGVNDLLSPDIFITLSRAKILSPTGQCQTFCEAADGYARAEGCGIVIIKPLKKAIQDRNKIWGVVRTGLNQDGRTVKPITAPSGKQHEELYKQVYTRFNVDPTSIQYFEAHGTGTRVGDPVEVNAFGRFINKYRNDLHVDNLSKKIENKQTKESQGQTEFGPRKNSDDYFANTSYKTKNYAEMNKNRKTILIGSVKTNIGHAESAAGMSGLIKVLLMMKNCKYVPSLHIRPDKSNLNIKLKLDEYGFDIATKTEAWRTNENGQRISCVNSFGFGGSNSHVIVIQTPDETPCIPKTVEEDNACKLFPVCVSAPKRDALKSVMESLNMELDTGAFDLQDVSFTSLFHRDHYYYRTLLFGSTKEGIKEQLARKILNGDQILRQQNFRVIFVFCGVGTTWRGMCREMVTTQPVFKDTLVRIDQYLKPLAGLSILTKIEEQDYDDPFLNHVAIFCTQVGLFELWKSWGIFPEAIVGQSVGEVAAAYASGALCLEDAVFVIYFRSKELAAHSSGSMLVVGGIAIKDIEHIFDKYQNRVGIAVYSSPYSCTLSGDTDAIDEIEIDILKRKPTSNIFTKRLSVQCAYHSQHVETSIPSIENKLSNLGKRKREINHYSTVTGQLAVADEFQTGKYWADNVRQPVRFMEAVKAAAENGISNVYIEVGPKPVLKAHLQNILGDKIQGLSLPSMDFEKECTTVFSSLCSLYELGANIKWENFHISGKAISVPRYTFNTTKMLLIPKSKRQMLRGDSSGRNMHMYVRSDSESRESFQIKLNKETTPFVYDHFLLQKIVVPGATYIEAAFDIAEKATDLKLRETEISTEFRSRLELDNDKDLLIEAEISLDDNLQEHHYVFRDKGKTICQGSIFPRQENKRSVIDRAPIMSRCKIHRNKVEIYDCLGKLYLRYGETLRLIHQSWTSEKECVSEIVVPKTIQKQYRSTHFHPSIIDALFQTCAILHVSTTEIDGLTLPKAFSSLTVNMPPQEKMYGYCQSVKETSQKKHYNLLLLSSDGVIIAEIKDFYSNTTNVSSKESDSIAYNLSWEKTCSLNKEKNSNGPSPRTKSHIVLASSRFMVEFQSPEDKTEVILDEMVDYSVLKNSLQHISSDTRVIFAPFYHISTMESESHSVFLRSKLNFENLALLLRVLKELSKSVPVFVVTEEVIADPNSNVKSSNISGAELWGMVRSIQRECPFFDIRLVDMTISADNFSILNDILWSNEVACNEYVIREGILFNSVLSGIQSNEPYRRQMEPFSTETLSLKSDCHDVITNVHFEYKKESELKFKTDTQHYHHKKCHIQVDFVCVHDASLYPISTVLDNSETSVWPECNGSGCQVLCIEGVGTVMDEMTESKSYISKQKVGFCFPADVNTIISVPYESTFSITDPSFYVPGMMAFGVVVWTTAGFCNNSGTCVILGDELKPTNDIISEIFTRQGKTVQIESMDSLTEKRMIQATAPDTLVILGDTAGSETFADILPARFPNLISIISIESYLPRDLERVIKHRHRKMIIRVLKTEDFFTSPETATTVQEVDKMFKSSSLLKSNTLKNGVNKSALQIPLPILKIANDNIPDCTIPLTVTREELFRRNGCYIIIGGLTGLGWELLQFIAELGAGCIATLSRRVPTPHNEKNITEIQEKYGCKVVSVQADIADIRQLETAIRELHRRVDGKFKIRGIFHGGAVTRDILLENMSTEDIEKPLLPKVLGSWNLHLATKDMPLDFFVMHSSIVSIFGNKGQCNYAAGNAFQDALANYRRSLGMCGQSINWGTLAVGMAIENEKLKTYLESQGFHLLTSDDIRTCFIRALMDNRPQVMFGRFDWKLLRENGAIEFNSTKFMHFANVEPKFYKTAITTKSQFSFDEYSKADFNQRKNIVESLIKSTVSEMLLIEINMLTNDSMLGSLGFDSMSATSFINSIAKATRVRLPLDQIYADQATIGSVTIFLVKHISDEINENVTIEHALREKNKIQLKSHESGDNHYQTNDTANEIEINTAKESESLERTKKEERCNAVLLKDCFTIDKEELGPLIVSLVNEDGYIMQWQRKDMPQELHINSATDISMNSMKGDFHLLIKFFDESIDFKTSCEDTATKWFKVLKKAIDRNRTVSSGQEGPTSPLLYQRIANSI